MGLVEIFSQSYTYGPTNTPVDSTTVVGVMTAAYIGVIILYAVPAIITLWKLFEKAGKPGWASIVPVYEPIVFGEIAKKPMWMGVTVGVGSLLSWIPGVNMFIGLPLFVLWVVLLLGLIKQYDRGVGFWLAYIFLPIVAVFLVKDAKYTGGEVQPQGVAYGQGSMGNTAPVAPSAAAPVPHPDESGDNNVMPPAAPPAA